MGTATGTSALICTKAVALSFCGERKYPKNAAKTHGFGRLAFYAKRLTDFRARKALKSDDLNGEGHPSWVSLTHPSFPLLGVTLRNRILQTKPCFRMVSSPISAPRSRSGTGMISASTVAASHTGLGLQVRFKWEHTTTAMKNFCRAGPMSCPPSCQPTPGHCRARQSGHILETALLLPPPAARRRFPRRPLTAAPFALSLRTKERGVEDAILRCTPCPVIANQCAHWCGERAERCQWQMKRGERVAAVKISSGSRKAAQKFWAPQQGHPYPRPRGLRILTPVTSVTGSE